MKKQKVDCVGVTLKDIINILAALDFVIISFQQSELSDFQICELRDLAVLKDKIYSMLD